MKKYKVAEYLRLSDEDRDKKESNSIQNQRDLIDHFIQKNNDLEKVQVYVDDGYTGANFERPGFKKMIVDLEKRENKLYYNQGFIKIWERSH